MIDDHLIYITLCVQVVELDGVARADEGRACKATAWAPILRRVKLRPDSEHHFAVGDGIEAGLPAVTHVRLRIFPDGGVSRLRVWGLPAPPVPVVPKPKI